MKSLSKHVNRKKASKITTKNRRKHNRLAINVEKDAAEGVTSIRPEDVKMHQHY